MTAATEERLGDLMGMGGGEDGRDRHYFAEIVTVDDWDCVLEKGRGKLPFDPSFHRPEQRRVNISIVFACTKKDGGTYELKQDDIASGSKHKVLLGSLDGLGVATRPQLRALVGQFAEVVRVPTGQKYQAKKDSADGSIRAGDMVPETALRVLRLFPTAEAARAAETEFYTPKADKYSVGDGRNVPQPLEQPALDAAARTALLATLPVLWQAAGQKADTLKGMLAVNPQYAANGITMDCDEVAQLTGIPPF